MELASLFTGSRPLPRWRRRRRRKRRKRGRGGGGGRGRRKEGGCTSARSLHRALLQPPPP